MANSLTNIDTKHNEALNKLHELSEIYFINRKYFIEAEEKLKGMSLFVAPLLEHRDALDHLMRFFMKNDSVPENDFPIEQLNKAYSHEIRAFFDVADYICINIRSDISASLENLRQKDIEAIWANYLECKIAILEISNDLSEIRNHRRGDLESVYAYTKQMDKLFDLYTEYQIKIEPRIKIKKLNTQTAPISIGKK